MIAKGDVVNFRYYEFETKAPVTGRGEYLGECADGHMVRAAECTKPENVGQIVFVQRAPQKVPA